MEKTALPFLYEAYIKSSGVTTDSRHCPEGSLFFALRGENFDGNRFAAAALEKGCAHAVVDDPAVLPVGEGRGRYLLVDDVLQALQQLARHHRRQLKTPMLAITGTNGKTTTKELTAAVLSRRYKVLYTEGNLNNQIGVPLTLLRLKPEHEFAIVEMGASHPGDIRELAEIAEPDFGLITNVGFAHLQGFGSFEGVVRTKGELYGFLRERGGRVFVNARNTRLTAMLEGLEAQYYAVTSGTPFPFDKPLLAEARVARCNPFLAFKWRAAGMSFWQCCSTRLIGDYNLDNALSAIAVGRYFGVEPADITAALSGYLPGNGRSQLKETQRNRLILDAYNANPTSMKASLGNFRKMDFPRKGVVLGDMKELGEASFEEHLAVMQLVSRCRFKVVVYVGPEFAAVAEKYPGLAANARLFGTVEELKAHLGEQPLPEGYTLLIKGSHSMNLSALADVL